MSDQWEIHNKLAGEIVGAIIKPVQSSGGSIHDVFVVLESVVCGVLLALSRAGNDDAIIDEMASAAKGRLKEIRMGEMAGSA